ncbi:bifunctional phosphoribosylaminoimidazolecarboxamide formyltransferase/IMP cyclohydrolase [Virgibacillus necropolis]|uniref:Bifunctional purine biosynthesis protein PurH n=1 Tax=Virgibacillus necropolis TaxID=163877 RepID=A0A221MHB3_9BACI|nr:bifunctional phosphoribosylaminoimidazolecarboxamide formyltransferase/IMP cyclohydrolase [Virgibacillus necropolis]ASN07002.1 bifunctional phosphoribosylaminoimidazolecarboxamide formyltransferase/IMP cyclohydrolase [Virgibacillus necropolis]
MTKRALISVSNKENIVAFAKGLVELDYEIISTGGTLKALQQAGVAASAVEDITDFPEILDGRVKTLHPSIHGGLLADLKNEKHQAQLNEHNITPIDLVIVNLYPFQETLANENTTDADKIENIDIGGPTMLRAAAKNFTNVAVVVDPADYTDILTALKQGELDGGKRLELAAKVFRHTAHYDALIAGYFNEQTDAQYPDSYSVTYEKVQSLRYGENPHQQAAFYKDAKVSSYSLAAAKQLHGKELSYNNIQDANAALEIIAEYTEPTAVAVKHMNPCGIGVSDSMVNAFEKAYAADSISIFGGIVACNRSVDADTASLLREIFLEIVIAPSFTKEALEILTEKKNIRLLEVSMEDSKGSSKKITSVNGGLLVQEQDKGMAAKDEWTYPTERKPSEKEVADLLFAWRAVKHVKSNAIVLAKDNQTVGIGAGQMNRIGSATIAIEQAGEKATKSVLASDAFFPMPDTVEAAVKAGVTAIIQPGGSKRDQDSIDVCDQHGIAMVYTGMRHFKH